MDSTAKTLPDANIYDMLVAFRDQVARFDDVEKGLMMEVDCGLSSYEEVREKLERMNKNLEKLVLEIHPYSIKQMEGKDNRWCTTIKPEGGNRKIIKKPTYTEIIQYLVDFYSLKTEKKPVTLRSMYPVWMDFKKSSIEKTSTLRRIDADWRKYYLNDKIIDEPLDKMSRNRISSWLNNKIVHEGVTKSQVFYNMVTIFKGIFEYCSVEKLIPENTFACASYRKELLIKGTKPLDESQVFTRQEVKAILHLAFDRFDADPKVTSYLGIALLFQTGLRVGELVTLKEEDYDPVKKTLSIRESETRTYEQDKDGTFVFKGVDVGLPKKTASIRTIPLSDEACRILDLLIATNKNNHQCDNGYLFVYNNRRIQTASVLKKIYSLCDALGYEKRSTHKIRKTVLSIALDTSLKNDIADISAIRLFAGHVDEGTLLKSYTFSTRKEEMQNLVNTALDW